MSYLLVGFGGFFGAIFRYLLMNIFNNQAFAYGTLFANSLGSFVVGVFFVIINEKMALSDDYRLALIVGFCGSLTTLSTISLDTFSLFSAGHYYLSALNLLSNIALSIVFIIFGIYISRAF